MVPLLPHPPLAPGPLQRVLLPLALLSWLVLGWRLQHWWRLRFRQQQGGLPLPLWVRCRLGFLPLAHAAAAA